MRPPLPTGTILQNRYRLLSVLGQGGFGRTYLAEDQGRFNELCALKELTPAQSSEYALEKSKELFQREAQTLYQIQHPQIPQFRATFEQDQRLFLVQDYVEGPTYRRLLDQRKVHGYAFSEVEVLQLLHQLLPVLAHIHAKGIIHRDIAPDNIILREKDGKPVLIDFGVVKELATRFQSPEAATPNTTVGKPGYAPSEQIHTGHAYPCSDLYSLAVTAVVLLTGREPQELFDAQTLTWSWQRWVTVDPHFAQVLNKMLSYRPGDRYQSVSEVVRALQSPVQPTQAPVNPMPAPPVPSAAATVPPIQSNPSQVPTMAVGRSPVATSEVSRPNREEPSIPAPRSSVWDEPWAVALIGLALVILTGIGSWAVVRTVLNRQPEPIAPVTPTVTPTPTPTATVTPTPTPTSTPVTYSQRLNLAPDARTTRTGSLKANETVNYIIPAQQNQLLSASLSGEGVLMTILGPDQQSVGDRSQRVSYWQGTLPYTGNYSIQLSPVKGLERSDYQLELNLQNPPEPSPPTPTPSTPPEDTIETSRVSFPAGAIGTTISDQAGPNRIKRYLVNATQGQILSASIAPNNEFLKLNIRYANGDPVENATGVTSWESQLPQSGDYLIDVVATEESNFQLTVSVR